MYMQTITNSAVRTFSFAFAALLLFAVPFAFAPKAHATDLFGGDTSGDYYPPDGSTYGDYYPTDTSTYGDYYPTDTSTYGDYYPTDYSYGSYGGYTSPSYGGYSSPYYTQPNYTQPNYTRPTYTNPVYTSPSYTSPSYTNMWDNGNTYTDTWNNGNTTAWDNGNTYMYSPSTTETCTTPNSCSSYNNGNTTDSYNTSTYAPTTIVTDSHNIVSSSFDSHNVYNPYPVSYPTTQVVYASAPVQPTYTQPAYQPTYQPTYQPRVAYNNPGISLAAIPYTGLDLGPWGTAVYWGFLVLWCLIAAYLIAVKKVQNKFATWLFGTKPKLLEQKSGLPASGVLAETGDPRTFEREVSVKSASQFSGIDPFIASQISRAF